MNPRRRERWETLRIFPLQQGEAGSRSTYALPCQAYLSISIFMLSIGCVWMQFYRAGPFIDGIETKRRSEREWRPEVDIWGSGGSGLVPLSLLPLSHTPRHWKTKGTCPRTISLPCQRISSRISRPCNICKWLEDLFSVGKHLARALSTLEPSRSLEG